MELRHAVDMSKMTEENIKYALKSYKAWFQCQLSDVCIEISSILCGGKCKQLAQMSSHAKLMALVAVSSVPHALL